MTMTEKKKDSSALLDSLLLTCPETKEPQTIVSVRGAEAGLDHCEIITRGKTTSWKHRIYTEEV